MRVLLTAFQPFDGTGLNASEVGCRLFLQRWGSEFEVRFECLPVIYGADTQGVDSALAAGPVDLILHTGQAAGSAAVRVERIAVNLRYATEACAREAQPRQVRIQADAPAAFFATLPVDEVAAAIRAEQVPATVTNHAGIYLCNHVLYRSLQRAAAAPATPPLVGFLHVPALPPQVSPPEPCLEAEQVAVAIRATIRWCELFHTK